MFGDVYGAVRQVKCLTRQVYGRIGGPGGPDPPHFGPTL